ncbi:hypothetical protein EBU91_04260 [bacterium]|nr:hypothetical protein [bacterium]
MKRADYKAIYKDILAEQKEFRQIGKDRAFSKGITFSIFKEKLSELHTWPSVLTIWYDYFNDYCTSLGSIKTEYDLSISEWAEDYFLDWKEETHQTELKSNFTPIELLKSNPYEPT